MAVKSISVPEEVKAYLDGLGNASAYVVGLIRKDREGGSEDLEQQIRRVLSEVLQNHVPIPIILDNGARGNFKNEIEDLINM